MKFTLSRISLAATVALSFLFMSCGGEEAAKEDTVDSLTDEIVVHFNEFVAAVESVNDKDSADRAAKKIGVIADDLVAISARLEALGEPSADDVKKAKEKINQVKAENDARMESLFEGLQNYPEAFPIVQKALSKFSEKMKTIEATHKKFGIN